MEEVIFIQRNNRRSHPQVLRIRDDGDYEVEDAGSPSPDAVLIGQYREVLCFQDSQDCSFVLWNFNSQRVEKEVEYSAADNIAGVVSAFAKTNAGEIRIVMVCRRGLSFATKVYKGENDHRDRAGEEEQVQADGWEEWQVYPGNEPFVPHQEMARFSVSEGFGCIYWAGSVLRVPRIVSYNIENEVVRCEMTPIHLQNDKILIGHGVAGELAASTVQTEGGFLRRLRVWCRRGPEWIPILNILLQNDSNAKSYTPLCFHQSRMIQSWAYIFMRSLSSIVRLIPGAGAGAVWAPEENLYTTSSKIISSALPRSTYAYLNKRFDKGRTDEEDEEFHNARRRKLTQPVSFDRSSI